MAFSSAWLDELLSKSDITDIVSSYIDLKPKGRKLWGLCPFHGEKTPSFSVSPDKQLFYCFGCHVGGSAIQFIMQMEKLSYNETIVLLAERAHMSLPDRASDEDYLKQKAYKERLTKINQTAARFFCQQLISDNNGTAKAYANKRGLNKEIILRFGIGFAPDSWDSLKNHLSAQGFTEKEMVDAGVLVHNAEKNSSYDTYRNRLIFPIQNITGSVIGFGGRVLDDSKPKYINTGDTPIYNKRNNLYGLNLLKQEKLSDIIIVEGYMDVVGLYKAGIHNAVASLGTALTVQQARLLKRYSNDIFIAYDGDFAGQNGMIRGLEILAEQGLNVHIIVFPENLDPDEYVQKYGKDSFNALKSEAYTISRFKLERMADGIDFGKEDQREHYALEACKYIGTLPPLVHDRYLKLVSEKTGYAISSLTKQIAAKGNSLQEKPSFSVRQTVVPETESSTGMEKYQCTVLQACVQDRSILKLLRDYSTEEIFTDNDFREFYSVLFENKQSVAAYIANLPDERARKLSAILQTEYPFTDPSKIVLDCIQKIKAHLIDDQISELQKQLAEASQGKESEIIRRITELQKSKRGGKNNGKTGR